MKQKRLQLLLVLLTMLTSIGANAGSITSGMCGTNLTWELTELTGSEGKYTLTISGTGAMTDYQNANKQPWKDYRDQITTVVVENGVTTIGKNAFGKCTSLETVTIGSDVEAIGTSAFNGCSSLKTINIPNKIEIINTSTFKDCTSLKSIDIPASVQQIGQGAFTGSGLENITIPDGVKNILDNAFNGCKSLKSVSIPASVESIYKRAFYGCSSLEEVTILATTLNLQAQVFDNTSANLVIYVPAGSVDTYEAYGNLPQNVNIKPITNPTYSVNLNDGTENPTTWKAKVGDATEFGKLPLENVVEGQTVTLEYSGSREVKSVKAKVIYPATATAPEANTATIIAGSTTQLVTGGTAEGGTMMYYVTTTNNRPTSTDDFSAAIPTAQACADAGTYYVWYYVKADGDHLDSAISSEAIQVTVKTIPAGAINGIFTIAEGSKVYFSKGNLQANTTDKGKNWTWAFADNQWDYIGNNTANTSINGNGTVSTSGTVDLFRWVGASGHLTGAAQYGITNQSSAYSIGQTLGEPLKADWGNTIGDNWRTLTLAEWRYLFNTRTSGSTVNGTSNARFTFAIINTVGGEGGVKGIILFPDGVTIASDEATPWGYINDINDGNEWETKCTTEQWTALEAKGCVFLPAAGRRNLASTSVTNPGSYGYYWSTTSEYNESSNGGNAYYLIFPYDSRIAISPCRSAQRYWGCSVRLVTAVE